ncbi:MAG: T9SS type A sorting domain-containing protein [Ignavibacteriaceae bacterium]|nr:T9SS type A sorting domain-containing protein [Ignavibacteriaceae bacterium]
MKTILFLIYLFIGTSVLIAQVNKFNVSSVKNAAITSKGIVFTDAKNSSLYVEQNGESILLTSSPGCGLYFSLSNDKRTIGYKQIDQNGNQIPSLIDITTKNITPLYAPVDLAGQVSFANDGTIAFTINNELIVRKNDAETKYDLGTYANIAPISPDAKFVAFNDNYDQLFLLNLSNGEKQKITNGNGGYFNPIWSPDGKKLLYSSLAATLKVYDLEKNESYVIAEEGYSPAWSNDSKLIIFYKKEIKNLELLNSDLYFSSFDGTNLAQLTFTKNQFECDPSFGLTDDEVIYSKLEKGTIVKAALSLQDHSLKVKSELNLKVQPIETHSFNLLKKTLDVDTLDIPYINQVYDTPDYYNGSAACGPTSAMMIVAYYKILPVWNITASWPYSHTSPYGRYICDAYHFRQISYLMTANDPNGKPFQGAYGFMWSGTSPYSSMVGFYNNHGITAVRADTPSYQTTLDEINAGRPYTVCNGLTTAGHIIVAHGTATQSHTLIFNDPYGNKNSPGYPNYLGKNAKYDWPGYNNGYQNLNTVYWSVSTNYKMPETSDTLIDDLDFANGFYMNNKAPVTMNSWKDLNQGYNGHLWYSLTTLKPNDSCYATWTPNIPQTGYYEVSAYILYSQAEAAKYKINSSGGSDSVIINQKEYKDAWVSLGKYQFEKGKSGYVRLGDASTIKGEAIVFDAVKWSYIDSVETSIAEKDISNPTKFSLEQNYPNPFNPVTVISWHLAVSNHVTLKIYNVLGIEIETLVNEYQNSGSHMIKFNATQLASGIYIYKITANNFSASRKLVLLR